MKPAPIPGHLPGARSTASRAGSTRSRWASRPVLLGMVLVGLAILPEWPTLARPALRPWTPEIDDHPGLLAADVMSIDGDDQGRVWFATAGGGASRYDPRTGAWRTFADAATLGGTIVMDVLVARDGAVWFGTRDLGTVRYEPDTGAWTRDWTGRGPTCNGHTLMEGQDGQVWVLCFEMGLHRYRPEEDRWDRIEDLDGDPLDGVVDIGEDEAGAIWVLTGSLSVMDPDTLERQYRSVRTWRGESESPLKAMHVDGRGSVWVSGKTGGLGRVDVGPGGYEHLLTNPDPAAGLWVRQLLRARDGRLWALTWDRGVRAYDPDTGGWRDPSPSSAEGSFDAFLIEDSRGDLWAGSWRGNLARFDHERQRWEAPVAPLITGETSVTVGYEDPRGGLWFGTRGAGALHFDPDSGAWDSVPMRTDGTLAGGVASSVTAAPDGDLWIASSQVLEGFARATGVWGGGIHRYSPADGSWTTYRQARGFRDSGAWTVYVTSQGHVLVGSYGRALALDRATDRFFPTAANFPTAMEGIRQFAEDGRGFPWAVNGEVGLSTARDASAPHWRTPSADRFLGGRTMTWLAASPEGDLWAGDGGAVAVLRAKEEDWDCCSAPGASGGKVAGLAFPPAGTARWWWAEEGRVGYQASPTSPVRWQEPPEGLWTYPAHNPGIALVDDRGAAWVGYGDGLVRFDADGTRVDVFRDEDREFGWSVDGGTQDARGALWFVDASHDITRLVYDDDGPHRPLALDGDPPVRGSAAVMEGRRGDGLCWARPGGLTVAGPRRSFQQPFSPVKEWNSAVDGAPGACWAGYFLSGVALVGEDGDVQHFGVAAGLPDERVLDVSQIPGDHPRAWVATDAGAALVDGRDGPILAVTPEEGSSPGAVDHVLALADGGAVLVFEPVDPRWFVDPAAAPSRADLHLRRVSAAGEVGDPIEVAATEVRDLALDGAGTVWIATDAGVFRLDEGHDEARPVSPPEGHLDPQRIAADPHGVTDTIWLASDGLGTAPARLLGYDPSADRWTEVTAADGLPEAPRIDMLESTGDGELVVMAGGRIVRGRILLAGR